MKWHVAILTNLLADSLTLVSAKKQYETLVKMTKDGKVSKIQSKTSH